MRNLCGRCLIGNRQDVSNLLLAVKRRGVKRGARRLQERYPTLERLPAATDYVCDIMLPTPLYGELRPPAAAVPGAAHLDADRCSLLRCPRSRMASGRGTTTFGCNGMIMNAG